MPREDEAAKLELLLLEAVDRPTQVALVKLEAPVPGHRLDLPVVGIVLGHERQKSLNRSGASSV
jgi:hypothetical protein